MGPSASASALCFPLSGLAPGRSRLIFQQKRDNLVLKNSNKNLRLESHWTDLDPLSIPELITVAEGHLMLRVSKPVPGVDTSGEE